MVCLCCGLREDVDVMSDRKEYIGMALDRCAFFFSAFKFASTDEI